jgi:hypothetical protein
LYNYGSNKGASQQIEDFLDGSSTSSVSGYKKSKGMSGGAKFGIIAAVGVVVGAVVAVVIKVRSGASDKKEPLMAADLENEEQEGTMA